MLENDNPCKPHKGEDKIELLEDLEYSLEHIEKVLTPMLGKINELVKAYNQLNKR